MSVFSRALFVGALSSATCCAAAAAQVTAGSVVGAVIDAEGAALEGVLVFLDGAEASWTSTDAGGAFRLEGVSLGRHLLHLRGAGYAPGSVPIDLDGPLLDVGPIRLSPGPDPTATLVGGVTDPSRGRPIGGTGSATPVVLRGLSERRETTNGYFLDREEIVARNVGSFVELLRDVPGVRVRARPGGTQILLSRRAATFSGGNECLSPLFFVDGILVAGEVEQMSRISGATSFTDLNQLVAPDQMAGLEVYGGASTVPTIFNRLGAACGVVAAWTIRYAMSDQALDAPVPGGRAEGGQGTEAGRSRTRRKVVIAAVVVPLLAFGIKSVVCSLPHYCR